MTPEPPLAIRLLGPPDVRRAGAEVAAPRGKLAALLARLVVDAAPAERAVLCELLWPGAPLERARLSLRVALSQLRSIAPGRVEATHDAVWFVLAEVDHPSAARWTAWIDRWWRDHPDHRPRPPDARGGPLRPAAERHPPRPPKPRRTA